jgi:hypothetical protein
MGGKMNKLIKYNETEFIKSEIEEMEKDMIVLKEIKIESNNILKKITRKEIKIESNNILKKITRVVKNLSAEIKRNKKELACR